MSDFPSILVPMVSLAHSGDPSISAGTTYGALSWNAANYDTHGMFSGGNPTRITFKVAGYYRVGGTCRYGASFSSNVGLKYRKGGSTDIIAEQLSPKGNFNVFIQAGKEEYFNEGDYIEALIFQNSGSSRQLSSASCKFYATWVAP